MPPPTSNHSADATARLLALLARRDPLRPADLAALAALVPLANINARDAESGYSPLHAALYRAHLRAALLILRARPDSDFRSRDFDNLAPCDLLNATISLPPLVDPASIESSVDSPVDTENPNDLLDRNTPLHHHDSPSSSPSPSPLLVPASLPIADPPSIPQSSSSSSSSLSSSLSSFSAIPASTTANASTRVVHPSHSNSAIIINLATNTTANTTTNNNTTTNTNEYVKSNAPPWPPAMSIWSWGSNSNYVLGHSSTGDRPVPERIDLISPICAAILPPFSLDSLNLLNLHIKMAALSKYHLAILANNRLFSIGFGPGGRLGLGHENTAIRPSEVTALSGRFNAIAVGPDHSIAIDLDGSIWTWGSNLHGQLGYTIDPASTRPPLQHSLLPHLVPIKKVVFIGAAGSKFHSAAFSSQGSLYTWGTNTGQLGYQVHSIQATPRKVTSFPQQSILQIAATNNATSVLVASNEVYVFAEDKCAKVVFPPPTPLAPRLATSSRLHIHHHHSSSSPRISKIVSGNHQFAALFSNGNVFLWSPPEKQYRDSWQQLNFPQRRPRLVWSARSSHLAARDVAIGIDSSVVIATDSGHVYIGTRRQQALKDKTMKYVSPRVAAAANAAAAATCASSPTSLLTKPGTTDTQYSDAMLFKYNQVPHLQHVVRVYASSGGAFAALRSDCRPPRIVCESSRLSVDMGTALYPVTSFGVVQPGRVSPDSDTMHWSTDCESSPTKVVSSPTTSKLWTASSPTSKYHDVEIYVDGGVCVWAHAIVLAARSVFFRHAFTDSYTSFIDVDMKMPGVMMSMGNSVTTTPTKMSGGGGGGKSGGNVSRGGHHEAIVRVVGKRRDGVWVIVMPTVHAVTLVQVLEFVYTGRFRKVADVGGWFSSSLGGGGGWSMSPSPLLSPTLAPVAVSGVDGGGHISNMTPSKRSGRDRGSSTSGGGNKNNNNNNNSGSHHRDTPLTTRVHQEFTRLAKHLRLDETEILYASLQQNRQHPRGRHTTLGKLDKYMREMETVMRMGNCTRESNSNGDGDSRGVSCLCGDVVVELCDGVFVDVYRVFVVARCPFFRAVLGPNSRWRLPVYGNGGNENRDFCCRVGKPVVRLPHVRKEVFVLVLAWVYCGPVSAEELFRIASDGHEDEHVGGGASGSRVDDGGESKDVTSSSMMTNPTTHLNAFVTLILDLLAAADELLLDQLKNTCGEILGRLMDIRNVTTLFDHADLHNISKLKQACKTFICWNIETMIELRCLYELRDCLVCEVEDWVRGMQVEKMPGMLGVGGYYDSLRVKVAAVEGEVRERRRVEREERRRERRRLYDEARAQESRVQQRGDDGRDVSVSMPVLNTWTNNNNNNNNNEPISVNRDNRCGVSGGSLDSVVSTSLLSPTDSESFMMAVQSPPPTDVGVSGNRSGGNGSGDTPDGRNGLVLMDDDDDDDESIFQLDLEEDSSGSGHGNNASLGRIVSMGRRVSKSPCRRASVDCNRVKDDVNGNGNGDHGGKGSSLTLCQGPVYSRGSSVTSMRNGGGSVKGSVTSLLMGGGSLPNTTTMATAPNAWSPVVRPQDPSAAVRSRPSLRDIMNETREQSLMQTNGGASHVIGEAGRPPVPSPARRSPALMPTIVSFPHAGGVPSSLSSSPLSVSVTAMSPTAAVTATPVTTVVSSTPTTPVFSSPFLLGDPMEFGVRVKSVSGGKLSQKQRKQQEKLQAQQQQQQQNSSNRAGSGMMAWSVPANPWGAATADVLSPTLMTGGSVGATKSATTPTTTTTTTPTKSFRQIQEEEMFKRMQIHQTPSRASLLTPGVVSSDGVTQSRVVCGWGSGHGWNTPSPVSVSVHAPLVASMSALSLGSPLSASTLSLSLVSSAAHVVAVTNSPRVSCKNVQGGVSRPVVTTLCVDTKSAMTTATAATTPVSLALIQKQQYDAGEARRRLYLTKPLTRIQIEERAVREIGEFYNATCGQGSGEWVHVSAV